MIMTTDDSAKKCASTCWYASVGIGLLLTVVLISGAGWALLWALLLGVVVFLVLGFVLPQVACTSGGIERPMAAMSASSSLVAGDAPPPPLDDPYAAAAAAAAATPPYFEDTPDEPAPQAHPVVSEARKPKTDVERAADHDNEKPETLDAPRGGTADDLKMIKGVGPKLEVTLNSMGFYHFDQIANWSDAEVAWVDENLQGFNGRATRDDWTGQAATLAHGSTTEFSARAAKGGVY
jgi:NADH-quinone oxidoreductase subunit E